MTSLMQSVKWLMFDGSAKKGDWKNANAIEPLHRGFTEMNEAIVRTFRGTTMWSRRSDLKPPSSGGMRKINKICRFASELKYIRSGSRLYSRPIENKSCTTRCRVEWKHAFWKLRMKQIFDSIKPRPTKVWKLCLHFSARDSHQCRSRSEEETKARNFHFTFHAKRRLSTHKRIFTINRLIYGVSVDFRIYFHARFYLPDQCSLQKCPKKRNHKTIIYWTYRKKTPKRFKSFSVCLWMLSMIFCRKSLKLTHESFFVCKKVRLGIG